MHWGVRRFQPYPKGYKGDGKYIGETNQSTSKKPAHGNPAKLSKYSRAVWSNKYDMFGTTSGTTNMNIGGKPIHVYATDITTAAPIMDRFDRNQKKVLNEVKDSVRKIINDTKRWDTTWGPAPHKLKNGTKALELDGITILNDNGSGRVAVYLRDNLNGDLWEAYVDAITFKLLEEPWIEG